MLTSECGPSPPTRASSHGFDTSAGIGDVASSLVWEKLRSLREGADLASERLL